MNDLTVSKLELLEPAALGAFDFDFHALPSPLTPEAKAWLSWRFDIEYKMRLCRKLPMKKIEEIKGEYVPAETVEVANRELRNLLFEKAVFPGPPFIYHYDPFADLIRQWQSGESGKEGLRNLAIFQKMELRGAKKRHGFGKDLLTEDHKIYRDAAIDQAKCLIKLVHDLINRYTGRDLDPSVMYVKVWGLMEREIKKNPPAYSAWSSDPDLRRLNDFLKAMLDQKRLFEVCIGTASEFVDAYMSHYTGYAAGQIRKKNP